MASDLEAPLRETLALCRRQEASLALELRLVDTELRRKARAVDAIERLETIPAVGDLVATTIYAWMGEISRFADAKSLAAYAGLVPSVYQSARAAGVRRQRGVHLGVVRPGLRRVTAARGPDPSVARAMRG